MIHLDTMRESAALLPVVIVAGDIVAVLQLSCQQPTQGWLRQGKNLDWMGTFGAESVNYEIALPSSPHDPG